VGLLSGTPRREPQYPSVMVREGPDLWYVQGGHIGRVAISGVALHMTCCPGGFLGLRHMGVSVSVFTTEEKPSQAILTGSMKLARAQLCLQPWLTYKNVSSTAT
jgi:hypothetical protein